VPRVAALFVLCLLLAGCMSEEEATPTQSVPGAATQPSAPTEIRYHTVVVMRDPNADPKEIFGPPRRTEQEAAREVAAIRRAMARRDETTVPWLAIDGSAVRFAYIYAVSVPE
jgi:hypothetical protein